jgi:hypothetical protein
MQEGACQRVQGAQEHNNQVAPPPDTIILMAPQPCVDKVLPAGIMIANMLLLLMGSAHH